MEQVTRVELAGNSLGSCRHTARRHLRLCYTGNITYFLKKEKRSAVKILLFIDEKIIEYSSNGLAEKFTKNVET